MLTCMKENSQFVLLPVLCVPKTGSVRKPRTYNQLAQVVALIGMMMLLVKQQQQQKKRV